MSVENKRKYNRLSSIHYPGLICDFPNKNVNPGGGGGGDGGGGGGGVGNGGGWKHHGIWRRNPSPICF